jgi:DNA-binding Lrp family transcriptional regulator
MPLGFVLINTTSELEHEVYNKLLKVPQIIEIYPLFGEYDLIAKIEAENYEKLGKMVIDKIRSLMGVLDTKTLTGTKF